ncbi:MAG: hypothetical protein JXR19_08460 [Bacteroidia bacterium]
MIDRYNTTAKVFPLLILGGPFILIVYIIYDFPINVENVGILSFMSMAYVFGLSQWIRSQGKKAEAKLFEQWGSKPTTLLLRRSSKSLGKDIKKEVFKKAMVWYGIKRPSKEEEEKNVIKSDQKIDAVVRKMIESTRIKDQFPVVFDELCTYGFWRNLYSVRKQAVWITIAFMLIINIEAIFNCGYLFVELTNIHLILSNSILVVNLFVIYNYSNTNRIKEQGYRYAKALFKAFTGARE